MQPQDPVNSRRRRALLATATALGSTGLAATLIPFLGYMKPSARAQAIGAPVSVDVSSLAPRQQITVIWHGRPVWILKRTPEMLADMHTPEHLRRLRDPDSRVSSQQPEYARNRYRSLRPEYFVVTGTCTHFSCVPRIRPEKAPRDLGAGWIGGYFCPCHGSRFDFAGRVFRNVPAPANLIVPPHRYLTDTVIQIGVNQRDA